MARFRAPSSTSLSSRGSMANVNAPGKVKTPGSAYRQPYVEDEPEPESNHRRSPSPGPAPKPAPTRKADKGKGRMRTSAKKDLARKESLRISRKKSIIETNRREWSWVYVGNLSSHISDPGLESVFKKCGLVRRVQIRASGGIAVPTANLPVPYLGLGTPLEGVHYATVEFTTPAAARKALELTGTELYGRPIVVSFNIIDMPEVTAIIKSQLEKKDPKGDKRTLLQIKFAQLKRLTIEKTEYVPDPREASGPSRHVGIAGLASRLARLREAGGTSTAAGDQKRHTPAEPLLFPKTLV